MQSYHVTLPCLGSLTPLFTNPILQSIETSALALPFIKWHQFVMSYQCNSLNPILRFCSFNKFLYYRCSKPFCTPSGMYTDGMYSDCRPFRFMASNTHALVTCISRRSPRSMNHCEK